MKKPTKNYVILGVIYLGIILLVCYLASWYQTYQEYQKSTPILENVLSEVRPNEIEHYLQEEPNAILYLCTASEMKCRDFEKEFKYYIKKHTLDSSVTYLNLSSLEDIPLFVQEFLHQYSKDVIEETDYPMLLQFEEGMIKRSSANLNVEKAKAFFEEIL